MQVNHVKYLPLELKGIITSRLYYHYRRIGLSSLEANKRVSGADYMTLKQVNNIVDISDLMPIS